MMVTLIKSPNKHPVIGEASLAITVGFSQASNSSPDLRQDV